MDVMKKGIETRFVAFLDILGFKELVKKIESENEDGQDYERVTWALDFLHAESEESNGHHDLNVYELTSDGMVEKELGDPRLNYISDCIIISAEGNFNGFKAICNKIIKLSIQGACAGIYMRGAITYGKIYHHGPILFGTAYQKALDLEKGAGDPRVLIDDVVCEVLSEHVGVFPLNGHAIRTDDDGKKYLLNYPLGYESGFDSSWIDTLLRVKVSILYFLNKFDVRVCGFCAELRRLDQFCCWKERYSMSLNFDGGDAHVLKKYIWLKNEFNRTLRRYSRVINARHQMRISPHAVQTGPRIAPITWNGRIWAPEKELGRYR